MALTGDFYDQLDECTINEDYDGMITLADSLDEKELPQYKDDIVTALEGISALWCADLLCDNIKPEGPQSHVDTLFDVLNNIGRFRQDALYFAARALCFEYQASIQTTDAKKQLNLQKAADEYVKAKAEQLEGEASPSVQLGNKLLDKMQMINLLPDKAFETILGLFERGFAEYSNDTASVFLNATLRILELHVDEKLHWHSVFMGRFNELMTAFAKKDPAVYLHWSSQLSMLSKFKKDDLGPVYIAEINQQSIDLLLPLIGQESDDELFLTSCGYHFRQAAARMSDDAIAQKIRYYEAALVFFKKAIAVNPVSSLFVLYATNLLSDMAAVYNELQNQEKLVEVFEEGRRIFATDAHKRDSSLPLFWGQFLVEYARLVYDFDAPEILAEAWLQLNAAKDQGLDANNPHLYTLLALVALKRSGVEASLGILKESEKVFSDSYKYMIKEVVQNDVAFEEIWSHL